MSVLMGAQAQILCSICTQTPIPDYRCNQANFRDGRSKGKGLGPNLFPVLNPRTRPRQERRKSYCGSMLGQRPAHMFANQF